MHARKASSFSFPKKWMIQSMEQVSSMSTSSSRNCSASGGSTSRWVNFHVSPATCSQVRKKLGKYCFRKSAWVWWTAAEFWRSMRRFWMHQIIWPNEMIKSTRIGGEWDFISKVVCVECTKKYSGMAYKSFYLVRNWVWSFEGHQYVSVIPCNSM